MSVENRWNDSDREKSKRLGKNLPHCHFVTNSYIGLGMKRDVAMAGRQLIAEATTRINPSASVYCVYHNVRSKVVTEMIMNNVAF
jgi:hypothetical protein